MQIFVTNPDPARCAEDYDDRRVNKMILKTSQLLSAAIYNIEQSNPPLNGPRKCEIILSACSIMPNKKCDWLPCSPGWRHNRLSQWATKAVNYNWLSMLLESLLSEWSLRFKKLHAYYKHDSFYILYGSSYIHHKTMPDKFLNFTIFKNDKKNIYDIYKKYLYWKWTTQDKYPPKWTNRSPPKWFINPTTYIAGVK